MAHFRELGVPSYSEDATDFVHDCIEDLVKTFRNNMALAFESDDGIDQDDFYNIALSVIMSFSVSAMHVVHSGYDINYEDMMDDMTRMTDQMKDYYRQLIVDA